MMNSKRLSFGLNVHAYDETRLVVEEHGGIVVRFETTSPLGTNELRMFLSDKIADRLAEELTDLVLLRKGREDEEKK